MSNSMIDEQPDGWTPVFDEKAYALAVHLKGFEAHIAGKENAKQFRDEFRMLLDMIKQPPYISTPKRESISLKAAYKNIINFLNMWKLYPAPDSTLALDMISDFYLCIGAEPGFEIKQIEGDQS